LSAGEPIPMALPQFGERDEELVLGVLRRGFLSLGPMIERFEREFAEWLGVDDAVAVSSGTAALHLGVRVNGWGAGDEVVTTPLTFVASSNCLLYEGATPVFCDVDPDTLTIDPAAARAALGERSVGILPVHIFGHPAAMAELSELASDRGLALLEDACQAPGAVDAEGIAVGARGNPSAFAFYGNKQLVTGEGGILVPGSEEAAALARSERNQGRDLEMRSLVHERLGFNYRMTEMSAAVGIAQLERLDELLESRRRVADWYTARLDSVEGLRLPLADRPPERRSWFVYAVQLPDEVDREGVIGALADAGIASKPYLPCIHLFPDFRERFGFRGGEFPVAEGYSRRALALPFFPSMTEPQVDRVTTTLAAAIGQPAPA
jgi:perosamine synthetase